MDSQCAHLAAIRGLPYNTESLGGGLMGAVGVGYIQKTGASRMPNFVLRVGSRTAQGVRANNEDFTLHWLPDDEPTRTNKGAVAILCDGVGLIDRSSQMVHNSRALPFSIK